MTFTPSGPEFFQAGFTDLVSVVPPGAQLSPLSKIPAGSIGKVPGRKNASGVYGGWDWRRHQATAADVEQWTQDGASFGLLAARFPGVDIDCTDPSLSLIIQNFVEGELGSAPRRTGRPPKSLLVYRTDEPFGRMRLWLRRGTAEKHLVEVLASGQQYLVAGIHPSTLKPYTWDRSPAASELVAITREQADKMLGGLADVCDMLGYAVEREGDGKPPTVTAESSASLVAPSIAALREAVELIPNTTPSRDEYIKMGQAIKAAAGTDDEAGYEIWAAWADKWAGNEKGPNAPETVRGDWRRMKGTRSIGWNWIAELARGYGFNDAALDFDALDSCQGTNLTSTDTNEAPATSDQALCDEFVRTHANRLRFVAETGKYLCWDGARWQVNSDLLAQDMVKQSLKKMANERIRRGATDKEKREALTDAIAICSAYRSSAILTLAESDRAIAVQKNALDADEWALNTPAGIVDLKTGALGPADPDALCTRSTSVAPANDPAPQWLKFLDEACHGDAELVAYLQRLAGYCLTGSVTEQHFSFIYGLGGNGKGTFMAALQYVLADYATTAPTSAFMESRSEHHSTDIAGLMGARMVSVSEIPAGHRWNEALVKSLTGGDPIAARLMRQDNVVFYPQFKLLFQGNDKPVLRDVGWAMRRRIHLVPFTTKPKIVDPHLRDKLRSEAPAILGWMIEGCLEWQSKGLAPPECVRSATDAYFTEEDSVATWLADYCELDPRARESSQRLFQSWAEWANANGERYVGTLKRLVGVLATKGFDRFRDPETRRNGFIGIRVLDRQDFGNNV